MPQQKSERREANTHVVRVQIKVDGRQSAAQAAQRVHRWLETFGHTATSFGFEFLRTDAE